MLKDKIRKEIILKRSLLSKEVVEKNSNIIMENLKTYVEKAENIMIFMNIKNEVKITKLIDLYPNKNFYIPKIFPNGDMKINMYNEKELILHKFGYYEADSSIFYNENILNFIIVPAVAFDKSKNRIGFGKGYYDRFLGKLTEKSKSCLSIGVCYDFQIVDKVPTETHDVKVDFIISEKRVIK